MSKKVVITTTILILSLLIMITPVLAAAQYSYLNSVKLVIGKKEFEVTVEDIIEFNLYHSFKSDNGKRTILYILLIILFLGTNDYFHGDSLLEIILTAVFVSLILRFIIPLFIKKRVKKIFKTSKANISLGKKTIKINGQQITEDGEYSSQTVLWNVIVKFVETKTHIFIYYHPNGAYVIPKRAFSSENEIMEFVAEVKKHLQDSGSK